jgi:protocatechuate 3,4-dioxygenase beta subunit
MASLILSLFVQQTDLGTIEGVVRSSGTNAPVAGAAVGALSSTPGVRVQGVTDAEGRFRLLVKPDRYQVVVTKQGFSSPLYRPNEPTPPTYVTAVAGRAVSVDLQLVPTSAITGRVFDPEGRLVEGASVALSRLTWTGEGQRMLISFGLRASGTTNDLGEYRLYWIPPGDYYMSVRDNGGTVENFVGRTQRYVTTYYPGAANPRDADTLHVPAGVELGGINLTLSRMKVASVRGRLVSPVADVADSVTIVNMSSVDESIVLDRVQVTFNDASKTFVAQNVLPGRYRIVATLRIPNRFNLSGETIVNVGEEPVENVVVSVSPSQSITGRLQIQDSSPEVRRAVESGQVHVNFHPDPSLAFLSGSAEVGKDGTFVQNDIGVARYRVALFGLPADAYIASARLGGADILENGFTLHGESPGPMEVVVSGLGGRIVGVVRSSQNEIVPSGRIVLVPEPDLRGRKDLFKVATLDQYGRFNIQGITPGRYKLFAWDDVPNGAYFDSEFLRAYEDQAKAVTVDKNDYIQAEITLTQRTVKIGDLVER